MRILFLILILFFVGCKKENYYRCIINTKIEVLPTLSNYPVYIADTTYEVLDDISKFEKEHTNIKSYVTGNHMITVTTDCNCGH